MNEREYIERLIQVMRRCAVELQEHAERANPAYARDGDKVAAERYRRDMEIVRKAWGTIEEWEG